MSNRRRYAKTSLALATALTVLLPSTAAQAVPGGIAFAPAIDGAPTVAIADTDATAQTNSLFRYLHEQSGEGILFGQQHATDYGITFAEPDGTASDVLAGTGEYPAVFGFDTLIIDGRERPGVSGDTATANADRLAQAFVEADAHGGLVTLSAHMSNFVTGGNYDDTAGRVVSQILPGGAEHEAFNDYLDLIARAALGAEREDGTLVPVIFRPFHENTGSWFWWGAAHATPGEYKEIFRYTVEYLRDVKGVSNLLYAFSPNGTFAGDEERYLATYPGDQFVDVLGYDLYESNDEPENSDAWISGAVTDLAMVADVAAARGKIPAFTEFGRNGDRTIQPTGNKSLTWFSDLLEGIKADPSARNIAYMSTWANFGGGQIYVPPPAYGTTPAHEMYGDFRAFYEDPFTVFSADVTNPYGRAANAAPQEQLLRFVTPADGARVTEATTTVQARLTGVDPADVDTVSFTRDGDLTVHTLTWDAASGYWTTQWEIGEEKLTNVTATLRLQATGVTVPEAVSTVILGEAPELALGLVDDFEGYGDDAALRAAYTTNNAGPTAISLTDRGADGQGVRLTYDYAATPEYLGFGRNIAPTQNWSGFGELTMDIEPDGSNHKLVVQLRAGGVTFEAYPSLATATPYTAVIPFAQFAPAPWDTANAGATLTPQRLSEVQQFYVYLNDAGGPDAGSIVVDDIHATGEGDFYEPEPEEPSAEPIIIDDFETYADDAALRAAWANRTATLQLSLADAPVGSGEHSAALDYDFGPQTYNEVARWLGGDDWSAHTQLSFWVDPADSGQQLLFQFRTPPQPGGSEDTFWNLTHLLTGEAGEVSLSFDDAVAGWPAGIDPSVRPTAAQLASVNELVVMISQVDATLPATGTVHLDDLRVDGGVVEPEIPGVVTITPQRALAVPAVAPGVVDCFPVAGENGVPQDAMGVIVNVTTVNPPGLGYAVVFPDSAGDGTTAMPVTSTVNFETGQDVANTAFVQLPANGDLCYGTSGADVGLIVDVTGYLTADSGIVLGTQARLLDTRPPVIGPIAGPLAPRTVRTVDVAGRHGVPVDAEAVIVNVTVTGVTGVGNLRVYPGDQERPDTSVLNYAPGQDKAGTTMVGLSDEGEIAIFSDSDQSVHVVIDVLGWTEARGSYVAVGPTRALDTRPDRTIGAVTGPLVGRTGYTVPIRGGAVPAEATGVVLNVTAIGPTTTGNLRVYPEAVDGGATMPPNASSINYIPGRDIPNLVVVDLPESGAVTFWSDQPGGSVNLAVDIVGYLVP